MNPERRDFLNLLSPPGRSNADETAWKLGFETRPYRHFGE